MSVTRTVLAAMLLLAVLAASMASASLYVDSSTAREFTKFKKTYNKKYDSVEEEMKRLRIFEDNARIAKMLQVTNPKAKFGMTRFFDLTRVEFTAKYANGAAQFAEAKKSMKHSAKKVAARSGLAAPDAIDWRKKGAVAPVQDQGHCGSCWAFSAIGNIEGQWFLAGNALTNLSVQQLVSCDDVDGCNGGWMDHAFEWLIDHRDGRTLTAESYPYVSGDGYERQCDDKNRVAAGQIYDYEFVEKDEDVMAEYLAEKGPIAIAVDGTTFQYYDSGLVTHCNSEEVNHAVLLVGYDDTDETPYWIIKNSWGTDWGEDGYIRIEKGTNQCLVTDHPVSALVHPNDGNIKARRRA